MVIDNDGTDEPDPFPLKANIKSFTALVYVQDNGGKLSISCSKEMKNNKTGEIYYKG